MSFVIASFSVASGTEWLTRIACCEYVNVFNGIPVNFGGIANVGNIWVVNF